MPLPELAGQLQTGIPLSEPECFDALIHGMRQASDACIGLSRAYEDKRWLRIPAVLTGVIDAARRLKDQKGARVLWLPQQRASGVIGALDTTALVAPRRDSKSKRELHLELSGGLRFAAHACRGLAASRKDARWLLIVRHLDMIENTVVRLKDQNANRVVWLPERVRH